MADPILFVGVVSHPRSSFPVNQGDEGLAAMLARKINDLGLPAKFLVNVSNDFDDYEVAATRSVFRAGIAEEVRLDREWKKFLGVRFALRGWIRHLARWLRVQSFLIRRSDTGEVRRLINIELSHTKLMKEGLGCGAQWVLILEDDAAAPELDDLVQGLVGMFADSANISFVNLSHSFSLTELGIDHLLHSSNEKKWEGAIARQLLSSDRPATNTVCAILYHRDFLASVIDEFEMSPKEPLVPIDWRLNQTLMNLWNKGLIGAGDCWFVEPPPIDQLSMRSS